MPTESTNNKLIEETSKIRDDLNEPKDEINHEQLQIQSNSSKKTMPRSYKSDQRKLGLSGISRSYQHMDNFSGGMGEDLHNHLQIYTAIAKTCGLADDEKANGMSFVLKKQALRLYIKEYEEVDSYDIITQKLLKHYANQEHQNRKLFMWQSTRLSDMLRQNPDNSGLKFFTLMVEKLMSTHGKPSDEYQSDAIPVAAKPCRDLDIRCGQLG